MRVAVKEGRTGSLTFGAGYSSLERATVFAEISQSNFDLFNSRSLFQGDGQKFRIRLELGQLSNEAIISFEEPYLFQKPLALGFSFFRTSSDYDSTYYQEVDLGGHRLRAQAALRADRRPAGVHQRDHRDQRRVRVGFAG